MFLWVVATSFVGLLAPTPAPSPEQPDQGGQSCAEAATQFEGKAISVQLKWTFPKNVVLTNVRVQQLGPRTFLVGDTAQSPFGDGQNRGSRWWLPVDEIAGMVEFPNSEVARANTTSGGVLPAEVRWHQRSFRVPFRLETGRLGDVESISLHVSRDEGKTWKHVTTVRPDSDAGTLDFTAPEDGRYWFAVQLETKGGAKFPAEPSQFFPEMRVLVQSSQSLTGQEPAHLESGHDDNPGASEGCP